MKKIAFLIHGTNKYSYMALNLANNIVKFADVVLFTNTPMVQMEGPIKVAPIDHLPWPLTTLLRYHRFLKYQWLLNNYNYIYHIDADVKLQHKPDLEKLTSSELVFTQHPMYHTNAKPVFNNRGTSQLNLNGEELYFWGSLFGGRTDKFLEMSQTISKMIDTDLKNGFIPEWWDEPYLNFYVNRLAIKYSILDSKEWIWPENQGPNDKSYFIGINKANELIR